MIVGPIHSKEEAEKAVISIGQELIKRAKDITNDIERVSKIKIEAEIQLDEITNVNVTKNYITDFKEKEEIMREIKFKGWNKATRKIINWNELLDMNLKNIFIMPEKNTGIILMQYTGLKDKNGKEIYEGDIVKHILQNHKTWEIYYENFTVEWDKKIASYILKNNTKDTLCIDYVPRNGEVIGNIWEDSDLLKEE